MSNLDGYRAASALTKRLAENAKYDGYQKKQVDFVEYARRRVECARRRIWKNPQYGLNVSLDYGDNIVTHSFIKEPEDDFIKWVRSALNGGSEAVVRCDVATRDSLTRTGAWTDSSVNNYTTEVGATFSGVVYGNKIAFHSYCDNRGGVWRFVVDGDSANSVDISTWRESAGYNVQTIKELLDAYTEHTVYATFLGADPAHAPTGGTARGWLSDETSLSGSSRCIQGFLYGSQNYDVLSGGSNRDFALYTTYSGTSTYVPAHSATASVTKIGDPVYTIDGSEYDYAGMANWAWAEWESSVSITQHFYGVVASTNVMEMWVYTTISSDGVVESKIVMKALQNITIVNGYIGMLPLSIGVLETAITSNGNSRVTNKTGAEHRFTDDWDDSISVCGVDSVRTGVFAAMSIDHIRQTNRQYALKGRMDILWGNQSATDYFKIYNEPINGDAISANAMYYGYMRHFVAAIPDVYSDVVGLF